MARLYNLAKMTTATTGTGTITLGSAVSGLLSFANAGVIDQATVSYAINDGANSEIGTGVYTASGTTLTRNVIRSTNSNAAINLSGAAQVAITPSDRDFRLPITPGGRLTLTSGVPVTESDVAASSVIYYTPCQHQLITVFDGNRLEAVDFGGELSLTLDGVTTDAGYHQAGKNFDVFYAYSNGGYYFCTGPAWASDTSRGTGAGTTEIENYQGVFVNKNNITARFGSATGNIGTILARNGTLLGTFRATANGQTEDSLTKRLVSNLYNTATRRMRRTDGAANWTYSAASYRQANANAANQFAVLNCVAGRTSTAHVFADAVNSTATVRSVLVAIGLDSTTAATDGFSFISYCSSTQSAPTHCRWEGYVGLGYHTLVWLELAAGSDVQTWRGSLTNTTGMLGTTEA